MDWDSRKSSTFGTDLENLTYSPRETTVIAATNANVRVLRDEAFIVLIFVQEVQWQKQNETSLRRWLGKVLIIQLSLMGSYSNFAF